MSEIRASAREPKVWLCSMCMGEWVEVEDGLCYWCDGELENERRLERRPPLCELCGMVAPVNEQESTLMWFCAGCWPLVDRLPNGGVVRKPGGEEVASEG